MFLKQKWKQKNERQSLNRISNRIVPRKKKTFGFQVKWLSPCYLVCVLPTHVCVLLHSFPVLFILFHPKLLSVVLILNANKKNYLCCLLLWKEKENLFRTLDGLFLLWISFFMTLNFKKFLFCAEIIAVDGNSRIIDNEHKTSCRSAIFNC